MPIDVVPRSQGTSTQHVVHMSPPALFLLVGSFSYFPHSLQRSTAAEPRQRWQSYRRVAGEADAIAAAAICNAEAAMIGDVTGSEKAAGYGELLAMGLNALARAVHLCQSDRFVDVGSGSGKLVFQAASMHNVASATGIELSPTRHAMAESALKRLVEADAEAASRVHLIRGDAVSDHQALKALQSASVVFANNLLFGELLNARLAELLSASDSLRAVVILKPFAGGLGGFQPDRSPLPCQVSWLPPRDGELIPPGFPCTVYRRVGDRSSGPLRRISLSIACQSIKEDSGSGK